MMPLCFQDKPGGANRQRNHRPGKASPAQANDDPLADPDGASRGSEIGVLWGHGNANPTIAEFELTDPRAGRKSSGQPFWIG